MFLPQQHLRVLHKQMLQEAMEYDAGHPRRAQSTARREESHKGMNMFDQQLGMIYQTMRGEEMEQQNPRPECAPQPAPEQRQRRLLRAPALLLVKLGRSLEGFGLAYLEERQQCSA